MPSSFETSAEAPISWTAAATMADNTFLVRPIIICASASDFAAETLASERRSRHRASLIDIDRARKIVQVTRDANARLIITTLTSGSAETNIVQGDSS